MRGKSTDELFEELYENYYAAIVAYFLRRGFSRDEARDLAQTTFVRVYHGMEGYRGESRWQWMLKIAKHVGDNEIRARRAVKRDVDLSSLDTMASLPHLRILDMMPGGPPPSQLDDVLRSEATEQLRAAVAALPPELRQYLQFWLAGHKYHDIVTLTRTTMDTVKTRIYRAKKQLKEMLGEDGRRWLEKKESHDESE